MKSSSHESELFPSLNGLRALCLLLVFFNHLTFQNNVLADFFAIKWLQPFSLLLKDGHLAVNMFFVISGFLITNVLLKEESLNGKISIKNFYFRRILRIFPAFYFLLLVYYLLQLLGQIHFSTNSWLTSLTYMKYFNWENDWASAHFWTLSIEEHFYFLWPVLFTFGPKFRKRFTIFLILLVPALRTLVHFHPISWIHEFSLFLRMDAIAIGCLFAFYKDQIIQFATPHWKKLFYFSIGIVVCIRFIDFPMIKNSVNLDFFIVPFGLTHGTFANFSIAFIMMYSAFGPKKNWYKFLNIRLVSFIGIISYSVYLWQQIFIYNSNDWTHQFPQNVIGAFIMGLFSYYLIETPFLKLKSKYSVRKRK